MHLLPTSGIIISPRGQLPHQDPCFRVGCDLRIGELLRGTRMFVGNFALSEARRRSQLVEDVCYIIHKQQLSLRVPGNSGNKYDLSFGSRSHCSHFRWEHWEQLFYLGVYLFPLFPGTRGVHVCFCDGLRHGTVAATGAPAAITAAQSSSAPKTSPKRARASKGYTDCSRPFRESPGTISTRSRPRAGAILSSASGAADAERSTSRFSARQRRHLWVE